MPEQVFFQCSLPRTGSTVFQNIINQNPDFYASANNGLLILLKAANESCLNMPEFRAYDIEMIKRAFKGFCKGSIHGFYNGITDKRYVLDKSRGNFANFDFISRFYDSPKIICLVRNIPDILSSMEKLFRKNQHRSNPIVNPAQMRGISTPQRVQIWNNVLRHMIAYLVQNIASGADKKMLFIKYETFCSNPEQEMNRFYEFLDVQPFKHDFGNIEQTILENEEVYGYTGQLKIRNNLSMQSSDSVSILGRELYHLIFDEYSEYNKYFDYDEGL